MDCVQNRLPNAKLKMGRAYAWTCIYAFVSVLFAGCWGPGSVAGMTGVVLSACGFVYSVEYEVKGRKSYFLWKYEEKVDWFYVGGII